MSSLADLPELVGFFSYSRDDDHDAQGALSALRNRINRELRGQLGRGRSELRLWQDQAAIPFGADWEDAIKAAVAQSVFFIPIVTPSSLRSKNCKFEFDLFLSREAELERRDLIFPILYIRVPALEDERQWRQDPVLKVIGTRQYLNWQPMRFVDIGSAEAAKQIENFCANIYRALQLQWMTPEERRERAAEDERRRAEASRKAAAEEEERRKAEAAEAAAKERRRAEAAEAARRAAMKPVGVMSPPLSSSQPEKPSGGLAAWLDVRTWPYLLILLAAAALGAAAGLVMNQFNLYGVTIGRLDFVDFRWIAYVAGIFMLATRMTIDRGVLKFALLFGVFYLALFALEYADDAALLWIRGAEEESNKPGFIALVDALEFGALLPVAWFMVAYNFLSAEAAKDRTMLAAAVAAGIAVGAFNGLLNPGTLPTHLYTIAFNGFWFGITAVLLTYGIRRYQSLRSSA